MTTETRSGSEHATAQGALDWYKDAVIYELHVRAFFDSNGDRKIDVYSYYLDGVEVYREIDSNFDEKIDQYRWLNSGGSRWGIDVNQDGKIDTWKQISAEEVGVEVVNALVFKDFTRMQALMCTEAEVKAVENAAEAAGIPWTAGRLPRE